MFFVISGFVISRAYLFPLIERQKTLTNFYLARIRRLAPALLLVLCLTSIAMLLVGFPDKLVPYSNSLAAQVLYVQNFVFWYEGSYFSDALSKPLLHTWSLAVEEQFYILWGFGILFWRRCPRIALAALALITVASLIAGFGLAPRSPKTVFFMLPTRIWEIAIGIFAFLLIRNRAQTNSILPIYASLTALAALLATGFYFDESSIFPGPQSLIATLSCAIILVCLAISSKPIKALRMAPLQYIGRISYGFYLWHWPPLALAYIATGREATPIEASALVVVALLGASASYHWIEQPIRSKTVLASTRKMAWSAVAAFSFILVVALIIKMTHGAVFLYPEELRPYFLASQERGKFRCSKTYTLINPSAETCPISRKGRDGDQTSGILILGDSHADVLDEMLGQLGDDIGTNIRLTTRNCDLGRYGGSEFCSEKVRSRIVKESVEQKIGNVIAISYWDRGKFTKTSFLTDVQAFTEAGINVHIMEVVPHHHSYPPVARARNALHSGILDTTGISRTQYQNMTKMERDIFLEAQARAPNMVTVLSPAEYLCTATACKYETQGRPLYFDENHLSFDGRNILKPMFTKLYKEILNESR